MSGKTCVVHLVWAPLGPQVLGRFLAAYRGHPAGAEHDLLVVFNGFGEGADLTPWTELLADTEHAQLRLKHSVLDLVAYREAAERAPAERYCFLNSYCVPLASGWLASMESALLAHDAGLLGPSGSWASIRSYNRFMLGLGGYYARVFDDRQQTTATLAAVASRNQGAQPEGRAPLRFVRTLVEQSRGFGAFPAPHIRTSAFMIDGALFRELDLPHLSNKSDALRLESGRNSITAQVERHGMSPLVVGRDGRAYPCSDWPHSLTFWQGDQENLLIADKQSDDYELGDAGVRSMLSRYAWGESSLHGTEQPGHPDSEARS